ncbi:MAG: DUF2059 domain-containing protein [Desulfobacterales bacterium]|nr:MAG: DUF2059 domain-containing protein [Desulfobacterales bacterium]
MRKLPVELSVKIILTLVLGSGLILTGDVYGGEKEQLELAFKLVEQTHTPTMFIELAEVFMEPYFEYYEPAPEDQTVINPLRELFKEEVSLGEEDLKWMLAGIYARHFTESELREIVDFFSSPAGNAWLEKRLVIQTDSEQIGLEWGKFLTQRVNKKFEAKMGKKF